MGQKITLNNLALWPINMAMAKKPAGKTPTAEHQVLLLAMASNRAPKTRSTAIFVKDKYPDLEPSEQQAVINYFKSINQYGYESKEYSIQRNNIIRMIGSLYNAYKNAPTGSEIRIKITAKLINFSKIIRGSGIKVSELRSKINNNLGRIENSTSKRNLSIYDLRKGPIEVMPDNLPIEIINILSNTEMSNGYSYLQYIKDNANLILFTPSLDHTVKMMDRHDIGTAEELTRSVLVDTFDADSHNPNVAAWSLAATAVTGTSHIEWYYKNNGDAVLLDYGPNERNAALVKYRFLLKLAESYNGTIYESDIIFILKSVHEKIQQLNTSLNYPKNHGIGLPQ